MSEPVVFENVCQGLEAGSSLDRLEARGTVRLALKSAGLDPAHVSSSQMSVVLNRVLPKELEQRGIDDATTLCASLQQNLPSDAESTGDSPEEVFARLGS